MIRIDCAAILSRNHIYIGDSHFIVACLGFPLDGATFGWLDSDGEFLNRKDAWDVAREAGQLHANCQTSGTLYSNNLIKGTLTRVAV